MGRPDLLRSIARHDRSVESGLYQINRAIVIAPDQPAGHLAWTWLTSMPGTYTVSRTVPLRLAWQASPDQIARRGTLDRSFPLVRRIRVSMSALAVTPVKPSVTRRGSALWTPKIVQQDSSPRMSIQVPRETPVG